MSSADSSKSQPEENTRIYLDETVECSFQQSPRSTIKQGAPAGGETIKDHGQRPTDGPREKIQLQARRSSGPSGFEITVNESIGSGGMAEVDAATQESLDREVALKRPRADRNTEDVAASLINEARLMANLDHPNIPPVHQLGFHENGQPVIVMKRVYGHSWRTLLHDPAHPYWSDHPEVHLKQHLEILRQVCNAVEYAHEKRILHRDLKTDNVMVGDFGEVYLLDWGVAIELDKKGERKTDQFCGTLCFAAPEMLSPDVPLTRCTDVYLLGCILHEILTLELRHQGDNLKEMIDKALVSEPYEYNENVPPALGIIANKAAHRDPDERYQNAKDFRKAIDVHLSHYHAMDLLNSTKEKLSSLEELYEKKTTKRQGFKFHEIAYLCRFGFQRVEKIAPDLEGAQAGLLRTLELQVLFELELGQIEAAKRIIRLIRDTQPAWERLADLAALLKEVENKQHESNELSTQIQYKLMEELQKRKKE